MMRCLNRWFFSGFLFSMAACVSSPMDGPDGGQPDGGIPPGSVCIGAGKVCMSEAYIKSSNSEALDLFGVSVALSGDTLAVGAPFEGSNATGINGNQADNSARESGAVYVFRRNNGVWAQEAYIKASNTEARDQFGYYVSLSGDTLVVGAPAEDSNAQGINGDQVNNSAIDSGAVYVFRRSGTAWAQEAYLKASNAGGGDHFGAVSLSGDTLAVGANDEDGGATGVNGNQADNSVFQSGAAYIFRRNGTTWTQEAYIKASNTGSIDQFGVRVSLSGDTLAVGSPGEKSRATGVNGDQTNSGASNSGAVYIFRRSGTMWTQEAYVKASNTDASDGFGNEVSLSGDVLAVAAARESSSATGVDGNQADNSAKDSGAVYIFRRNGTTWAQEAYVKASNTEAGDVFGLRISLSGDALAVGSIIEASNATGVDGNQADNSIRYSGAVYLFRRSNNVWSQGTYLKASNAEAMDQFSYGLALSGDTLAVGAASESSSARGIGGNQADNGAPQSGAVYVYR